VLPCFDKNALNLRAFLRLTMIVYPISDHPAWVTQHG